MDCPTRMESPTPAIRVGPNHFLLKDHHMHSHCCSLLLLTLIAATASAAEACGPGCGPGDAPAAAPVAAACAPASAATAAPAAAPAQQAAAPAAVAPQRRTLAALLDAPDSQRDVPLILEGHFVNVCCAGCFTYKEGVDAIEVRTTVTGWERYAAGTAVRLQGSLRVVEKRTAAGGTQKLLHIEATSVETR